MIDGKKATLYSTCLIYYFLILLFLIPFVKAGDIVDSPALTATLTAQEPDPVDQSEEVELRFSIINNGTSPSKNTEFRILTNYPFTIASGEEEIKKKGDIQVYDSKSIETGEAIVKYKLLVNENAFEGEYEITLEYKAEEGISKGNWIEFDPFTVKVGGKATNIIIEETKTDPERIAPGQSGDITLLLANKGANDIEDISIMLNLQNTTDIFPLYTSNEIIIKHLSGGETAQATFSLIVAADADVKIYTIPVKITYNDQRNNEYEKTTYVSIVVDAEPEYVLNVEETEVYKEGQNGNIVVSLSNIGIANINYATLSLLPSSEYTILSSDTVYLGNLESDDYETAQFKIYTNEYIDELPLQFRLVYKDAYNKNYDEEVTLTTKMFTAWEAKKYGFAESGTGFWWFIGIIIIAAGAWYFWKWRKKQLTKR